MPRVAIGGRPRRRRVACGCRCPSRRPKCCGAPLEMLPNGLEKGRPVDEHRSSTGPFNPPNRVAQPQTAGIHATLTPEPSRPLRQDRRPAPAGAGRAAWRANDVGGWGRQEGGTNCACLWRAKAEGHIVIKRRVLPQASVFALFLGLAHWPFLSDDFVVPGRANMHLMSLRRPDEALRQWAVLRLPLHHAGKHRALQR